MILRFKAPLSLGISMEIQVLQALLGASWIRFDLQSDAQAAAWELNWGNHVDDQAQGEPEDKLMAGAVYGLMNFLWFLFPLLK